MRNTALGKKTYIFHANDRICKKKNFKKKHVWKRKDQLGQRQVRTTRARGGGAGRVSGVSQHSCLHMSTMNQETTFQAAAASIQSLVSSRCQKGMGDVMGRECVEREKESE